MPPSTELTSQKQTRIQEVGPIPSFELLMDYGNQNDIIVRFVRRHPRLTETDDVLTKWHQ